MMYAGIEQTLVAEGLRVGCLCEMLPLWSAQEAIICPSFIRCDCTFCHSAIYTTIAKFYYFWNVPSINESDPSHLFQFRKYSTILHWLEASQKSTNPYPRFIFSPILHLRMEGPHLNAYFTSQGITNTTSSPQSFTRGYAIPLSSVLLFEQVRCRFRRL